MPISKLAQEQQRKAANAAHANEEEAFERFIDSLVQLPAQRPRDPNCSWCNWRRGDSPRNLRLCGFHQMMRNNMQRGV
jgi:hypothetical protein